ncbi:mannitol dehydrogenase family protein [Aestuariimicrobium ganziense]|uniref:mannitol dehydrogenase family protein n=1 Tax=Aestuariimicrobium ganziense TaxID=2773677 RepID=UPI002E2DB365|nr:mannitol dehydrogenase family protein [Aestuariimicrobium ganziense]
MTRPLHRDHAGRPKAPIRIVHLGIGNFARAHQAWYTEHAPDADKWGIAAFTGRSPAIAEQLSASDGVYQLVVQGPEGDQVEVISSLSAVHPADDLDAWRGYFTDRALSLVTSTITEAGYRRDGNGDLDLADPAVADDLALLSQDPDAEVTTAAGRFLAGLLARRNADAGPITFVPCDNVPHNGPMVARILAQGAARLEELGIDPGLVEWIEQNVGVVTTMVDRITPRATDDDRTSVATESGWSDPALVVTEPFSEWVLSDTFATPRPQWEQAGAQIVDDVALFERRKLLLLNGSHSLMAYGASVRGHETVYEAINDPVVESWVNQWWDEATSTIDLPHADLDGYRAALLERYRNPRIRHLLAQIAADGSQKVPIRIVGVVNALLERGEVSVGGSRALAAWLLHLRGLGAPVTDPRGDELSALVEGDLPEAARALLAELGITDEQVVAAVVNAADEITADTDATNDDEKEN